MRSYIFSQDRTRERKFVQLPLSLYLLVHLCNSLDIVSHFLHHFGGSQDADTLAQAADPSIELRADLNIRVNGEMLFIVIREHHIFTESVNNNIRQVIGETHFHSLFFAVEHIEHPQRSLVDVHFAEHFFTFSLLGDDIYIAHLIHAEVLHFSAFVSQKIVVVVAPQHCVGACHIVFLVVDLLFLLVEIVFLLY